MECDVAYSGAIYIVYSSEPFQLISELKYLQ